MKAANASPTQDLHQVLELMQADEMVLSPEANEQLQEDARRLRQEQASLFGAESLRYQQLQGTINDIEQQARLYDVAKEIIAAKYSSRIPLEPLRWRHPETGLPTLWLCNIHNPLMSFEIRTEYSGWGTHESTLRSVYPGLPDQLLAYYEDLPAASYKTLPPEPRNFLEKLFREEVTQWVTYATSFSGIIPPDARQKIKTAERSGVFEHIFLICEVPGWEISETQVIKRSQIAADPIAVGWHSNAPEFFWYIDSFDLTELENTIPVMIG